MGVRNWAILMGMRCRHTMSSADAQTTSRCRIIGIKRYISHCSYTRGRVTQAGTLANMLTLTLALCVVALAHRAVGQTPASAHTPAAVLPRTIFTPTETRDYYTPTESWDYATTPIPKDEYYLGAIKIADREESWSLSCIHAPLTTIGAYAGCGLDDLYKSCSGSYFLGADGGGVRCADGAPCVTHKIFEDLAAYNASSSTRFVGCGYGTATLEMVRNPISTGGAMVSVGVAWHWAVLTCLAFLGTL